jgi:phosphoglucosamine mutase
MGKYFGTDGIRGRFGLELNSAMAFKLGQSLKTALNAHTLVVGMDTRESSSELMYSVVSGAQSMGIDVIVAGVLPTPMISYYAYVNQISGVMITASHNPYKDNGIKVFDKGVKCTKEQEDKMEDYIDNQPSFEVMNLGKVYGGEDVFDEYLNLIESLELEPFDLKIAIDTANGANHLVAQGIFRELSQDFVQIGHQPNGKNINKYVGSTHMEAIKEAVELHRCDVGLSFDGDGDRVLMVDQDGDLFDGDLLIYILAKDLKEKGLLKNNKVVLTVMSNLGIIKALERQGIEVITTKVGDKYVKEALLEEDASVGGENSGHIIMPDYTPTGDGLFVGLYLLSLLSTKKTTLKELTSDVHMWPQVLTNIRTYSTDILEDPRVVSAIDQVKETVGQDGKVLIRKSGTEPLIRVTISAKTDALVAQYTEEIVSVINLVKDEVK